MTGEYSLQHLTVRRPGQLSGQLSLAASLIFVAVTLAAILGLKWSTERSDAISVERQVRVAQHAMEITLDELALQQETVAIWDESAVRMTDKRFDQQWLYDNIGSWLHRIFGHDEAFLLDGSGKLVQAVSGGRVVDASRFEAIRAELQPLISGAYGLSHAAPDKHDRLPGKPLHPDARVRTTERTTHDTHRRLIGGRPAAVSAMLIKPSTPGFARPRGKWPMLISIRFLDGSFMRELESRYLISSPRFSRSDRRSPMEHALLLQTVGGEDMGYLIWTPERPGSRILASLLPLVAVAISVLGMVLVLLTRSLRQTLNERAKFEARAAHLAYHDSLTGLPNRAFLAERMQESLCDPATRSSLALLLIDLDDFKRVNDSLGHLAGDQLIRQFAERLHRLVPPSDLVARLGGDEFAVLLSGQVQCGHVQELCDAIIELFRLPFDVLDTQIFGGASIGAVISDGHIADATELMRRADVALYRAKGDGRGCSRLFESGMDDAGRARASLEGQIRKALEMDDLAAWAQPQVSREKIVVGQELLLRWRDPSVGHVGPQEIIPLAEETGLIVPIGDWVLRRAAAIAAASPGLFTAVNLSPVQLREPRFADRLGKLLADAGASPQSIELEVTEETLLDESSPAIRNLQQLRQHGFRIALDDFGTGYSSLSYLRRLPVDKIKIDRSFVADLEGSQEARAIVAAIVTLGRALKLTVGAEGVETPAQAKILIAIGCDQLQGYLFGAPAPLADEAPERKARAS